jgi:hypothetical protein
MLRRGIHRIVIALVLAAALLAPAASPAAEPSRSAGRLDLDTLWAWAHLWLGLPGAPAASAPKPVSRKTACDGGGSIDPNGHTVCKTAAGATSEGGSSIDPDGIRTPSSPAGSNSDGGSHIDPNG